MDDLGGFNPLFLGSTPITNQWPTKYPEPTSK